MKSKLRFILVGDNALVDEKTGKLSIIGLFTDVKMLPGEKKAAINFVVAGQLLAEGAKEGDTGNLTINILNPDQTLLKSEVLNGPFEKGGKVQFTAYFQFIELEQIGEYKIEALLDGDLCEKDERLCFFNVSNNG